MVIILGIIFAVVVFVYILAVKGNEPPSLREQAFWNYIANSTIGLLSIVALTLLGAVAYAGILVTLEYGITTQITNIVIASIGLLSVAGIVIIAIKVYFENYATDLQIFEAVFPSNGKLNVRLHEDYTEA